MQAAIREVEKKYLKLDEPVLNSVISNWFRFQNLLAERETSIKKSLKIYLNILMKKRLKKLLNILRPAKLRVIGVKLWRVLALSVRILAKMMMLYLTASKTFTLLMRKEVTTLPLSSTLEKMKSLRIRNSLKNSTSKTVLQLNLSPLLLNGLERTLLLKKSKRNKRTKRLDNKESLPSKLRLNLSLTSSVTLTWVILTLTLLKLVKKRWNLEKSLSKISKSEEFLLMKYFPIVWNITSESSMKVMMLTERMVKNKRIVMMNKKEERRRARNSLNPNLNPNLKAKIKRTQNPKKSQNVNSNDI